MKIPKRKLLCPVLIKLWDIANLEKGKHTKKLSDTKIIRSYSFCMKGIPFYLQYSEKGKLDLLISELFGGR